MRPLFMHIEELDFFNTVFPMTVENNGKTPPISTVKKWYSTFQQSFPQKIVRFFKKIYMIFHKKEKNFAIDPNRS